jgi:hypothetical protein
MVCRPLAHDRQSQKPRIPYDSKGFAALARARLFYIPFPVDSFVVIRTAVPGLFFLLLTAAACPGTQPMNCSDSDRRNRPHRRHEPRALRLAELDRRLLGVLCAHRVVTQQQLGRLFPDTPERTLRYRTRRLYDLGLAGRSRPYRERGSAPNHHWPTRRADCLLRGDPVPRGGERREPNPVFLAHAAALTELYVALATGAGASGLVLREYRREGEAREAFQHEGKERALAPDALLTFTDAEDRGLLAFVELDLGTMSHARLRQKAELYAAYAASGAWREQHAFQPALLFLTNTSIRAARFLRALAGVLSYGPRRSGRHPFIAAAGGLAWEPQPLLADECLADLDGREGLTLSEVLWAARGPYERARAAQREEREAEEAKLRRLNQNPEALREHLHSHDYRLRTYREALDNEAEQALALLVASTAPPNAEERRALQVVARDLGNSLLDRYPHTTPQPGAPVADELRLLGDYCRASQRSQIETLAARYGQTPSLRRAWRTLHGGRLLDAPAVSILAHEAERDNDHQANQHERQREYMQWREHAAQRRAKEAGRLGRLTHRREDFYPELDRERLQVCTHCRELVYPTHEELHGPGFGSYLPPRTCHYCNSDAQLTPYRPSSSTESEA